MLDISGNTIKMLAFGCVIGAVAMTTLGFWQLGWVTENTAVRMASEASTEAYVSTLTPQCVSKAEAEPDKLSDFQKQNNWKRRSFVEDAGWVTYPQNASSNLKRTLAEACAKRLASS